MTLSNRSSLRLNLSSNEFESRKANQQNKTLSKQNLISSKLLNQKPQFIDSTLSLKQQSWYHGAISRYDAEQLLKNSQPGTFLLRNSEFNKYDYSLSLRSVKGYMHIKIESHENFYTLALFNKPFSSVSELVYHYSLNKLPLRNVELSLLFPLNDQLL